MTMLRDKIRDTVVVKNIYYTTITCSCMQRIANNINILESHYYVTSNLQLVAQKYSKCSDPYTLLCDIIM